MRTRAEHGQLEDLAASTPFAGIERRSFSSQGATVAAYRLDPGARFPMHTHSQEQITLVEEGDVEMTVGRERIPMGPGAWSITPPSVEHGIVAGRQGARFVVIVVPRRSGSDEYSVKAPPGSGRSA